MKLKNGIYKLFLFSLLLLMIISCRSLNITVDDYENKIRIHKSTPIVLSNFNQYMEDFNLKDIETILNKDVFIKTTMKQEKLVLIGFYPEAPDLIIINDHYKKIETNLILLQENLIKISKIRIFNILLSAKSYTNKVYSASLKNEAEMIYKSTWNYIIIADLIGKNNKVYHVKFQMENIIDIDHWLITDIDII